MLCYWCEFVHLSIRRCGKAILGSSDAYYKISCIFDPIIMSWPFTHLRYASSRMFRPAKRSLSLSSVEGPLNPPLSTSTLSEYFLQEILEKRRTRPALICRNELPRAHGGPLSWNLGVKTHLAWDFEEFDRHIKAVARGLLTMGVQKGDRVGVLMGNNRYYVLSLCWLKCDGSLQCIRFSSMGMREHR